MNVFSKNYIYIQRVPGVKVTTSGFNSRGDSESKTPYTHGSNSQRFRSYEFLKYMNPYLANVENMVSS